ncbi:MAG TPA: DNA-3-methyladenine glycosylase [Thermoanaerobaculia bacterium]|nr:DNA-3-methyladenine glycosylase [Thermoanaerobaculia bacterium]
MSFDALTPLPVSFFDQDAATVAAQLLGRWLVRELPEERESPGGRSILEIVETEAYLGGPDRASHAWGGRRTPRNESLYLPPGHAYVYFIYGMHFCLNVVTGRPHPGAAVLFRAGEPLEGEEAMAARRGLGTPAGPGDLAGGPGKLCQALAVDRSQDGLALTRTEGGLWLAEGRPDHAAPLATGPRIGVAYAGEAAAWPLRFARPGNRHVSRPRL